MKVKMRLLLLTGVVLIILTGLIVMYGFRRTEELQQEQHVQVLMKEPRTASFGDVPVGLALWGGGNVAAAEDSAVFDDGLVVKLIGVERRPCTGCGPSGEPTAMLRLSGAHIPKDADVVARVSRSSLKWRDHGYLITMLDIDETGSVVFTVDLAP